MSEQVSSWQRLSLSDEAVMVLVCLSSEPGVATETIIGRVWPSMPAVAALAHLDQVVAAINGEARAVTRKRGPVVALRSAPWRGGAVVPELRVHADVLVPFVEVR